MPAFKVKGLGRTVRSLRRVDVSNVEQCSGEVSSSATYLHVLAEYR